MFSYAVAPMMGYTHRWARIFYRMLSQHVQLYTEMVVDQAVIHGCDVTVWPQEGPVILQLGGSDPDTMARAVAVAEHHAYSAYNINVGCPSDRVKQGSFGACLMKDPPRVAAMIRAMRQETHRPVEVKTRLGVDDQDSDDHLYGFLESCLNAGCGRIILHARKAWLSGLSPAQNRSIPPLQYDRVLAAKARFPEAEIMINGGLRTFENPWQETLDGVMLGRAVWDDPEVLLTVDPLVAGQGNRVDLSDIVGRYIAFCQGVGARPSLFLPPLMGLGRGRPGARAWRQSLTDQIAQRTGQGGRGKHDPLLIHSVMQ
jgi:tRNA-dihydrouridine synthase A